MKRNPAPRPYTHHTTATVRRIRQLYPNHTRYQIAAILGLAAAQVKELCRRHRIIKCAPKGRRWDHPEQLGLLIVNNSEIQCRAAA